ncbi:MAG: hypothetical protein ACJAUR_001696 [Ulvibacter sp.]|jgi:hypothetical protein
MESGLNFIDFLKYGAIGVALALAILSYRLLSKEQDQENVREPMLKSIKTFFMLSILLSLFFGITEIITLSLATPKVEKNDKGIKKIWNHNLNTFPDKSYDAKYDRIEEFVELGQEKRDASDCANLQAEVGRLTKELKDLDGGFYSNVTKLDKMISSFADRNINIEFEVEKKTIVFEILEEVLISLDLIESRETPIDILASKWKELKMSWGRSTKEHKYIYQSDIRRLIQAYHDILETRG